MPADLDIPPPNDIEATGHCCCNGCVGEGKCDLAEPEERAAAWRWDDEEVSDGSR